MGFPQSLPREALTHIVEHFRGTGTHTTAALAEDAYDVLGYGLYLGIGTHHPVIFGAAPADKAAKAAALEGLLAAKDEAGVAAFNWSIVLTIALDLLKELIVKLQS